jgi:hypothetical protein
MTVPLGNTPSGQANTPEELKTQGLVWMGQATRRNEPPVIVFYRTLEFPPQFAPKAQNLDPNTGRPRLVDPVVVDLYFPNGPLAGRVYRRVGFINRGWTQPIRATAIGSINVGQLGVDVSTQSGSDYPQLNGLDKDALDWASKIHQEANGDVFAHYSGQPSPPVAQTAPVGYTQPPTQPPADRFAGVPTPAPGSAQTAGGPPPGMPGAGGPPPGFAQPAAQGAPQGFPGSGAPAGMPAAQGQPGPIAGPPPNGVPAIGQPATGVPSWAQQ